MWAEPAYFVCVLSTVDIQHCCKRAHNLELAIQLASWALPLSPEIAANYHLLW